MPTGPERIGLLADVPANHNWSWSLGPKDLGLKTCKLCKQGMPTGLKQMGLLSMMHLQTITGQPDWLVWVLKVQVLQQEMPTSSEQTGPTTDVFARQNWLMGLIRPRFGKM